MDVDHSCDPDELRKFVKSLDRFRLACGQPSLRELVRVSERVVADERYKKLQVQALSLTALSDVLGHRRERPPRFRWVAVFVLSCQRFAAESGLRPDPGASSLPEWNDRLQAVYVGAASTTEQADQEGTPSLPGELGVADPPAAAAQQLPTEPMAAPTHPYGAAYRGLDAQSDRVVDAEAPPISPPHAALKPTFVGELLDDYVGEPGASLSEVRFFRLFGQYGVRLLNAAEENQDAEAFYRLGMLLCITNRPAESLAWLRQAENQGHVKASELIDNLTPRMTAVIHAHKLAIEATECGDADAADVLLEHTFSPDAKGIAFDLGMVWKHRKNPVRASYWLSRAADYGHWLAREWAEDIRHEVGWKTPLPAPPREHSITVPTLADLIGRILSERDT
jgi:hypothetical protein